MPALDRRPLPFALPNDFTPLFCVVGQTRTPGQFTVWALVERQLHRLSLTVRPAFFFLLIFL